MNGRKQDTKEESWIELHAAADTAAADTAAVSSDEGKEQSAHIVVKTSPANSSAVSTASLQLPNPLIGIAATYTFIRITSITPWGLADPIHDLAVSAIAPLYWVHCVRSLSRATARKYGTEPPLNYLDYTIIFLSGMISPVYLFHKPYDWTINYPPIDQLEPLPVVAFLFWVFGQSLWIYKLNRGIEKAKNGTHSTFASLLFPILANCYLLMGLQFTNAWLCMQMLVVYLFKKNLSRETSKTKAPIRPNAGSDILIEYHPFAALTKWRKQQEQSIGKLKIIILASCIAVFVLGFSLTGINEITATKALLGQKVSPSSRNTIRNSKLYPLVQLVFSLNGRTNELLQNEQQQVDVISPNTSDTPIINTPFGRHTKGGTEWQDESTSNLGFLSALWNLLWMSAAGSTIYAMSKPTYLGLGKNGWRFIWFRKNLLDFCGPYQKWEDVKSISLKVPAGKTGMTNAELCFTTQKGQTKKIKMGSIDSIEDRETILKAIQKWAPNAERDANVTEGLQPPPDHSYTELWMQALSAPPKRERLKPLVNGTILKNNRYTIVNQIGTGGQGQAYIATDTNASGTVVLKEFILPVFVDVNVRKSALEQFENEAKILRQLDHPQIVKLVDFFVEDHRAYLVLEHISGASLRQIVKNKGTFDQEKVKALATQMCEILNYLHGLNPPVVHRDFTPDNLILNDKGLLKLIDFNVAKQVVESTTSGTVVGKHAYLPPEQFRGMPECASDIYAMGGTLHYLLTGSDPEPLSVSRTKKVLPDLSDALAKVIETCTALDSSKRYRSPADLRSELNVAE